QLVGLVQQAGMRQHPGRKDSPPTRDLIQSRSVEALVVLGPDRQHPRLPPELRQVLDELQRSQRSDGGVWREMVGDDEDPSRHWRFWPTIALPLQIAGGSRRRNAVSFTRIAASR